MIFTVIIIFKNSGSKPRNCEAFKILVIPLVVSRSLTLVPFRDFFCYDLVDSDLDFMQHVVVNYFPPEYRGLMCRSHKSCLPLKAKWRKIQ